MNKINEPKYQVLINLMREDVSALQLAVEQPVQLNPARPPVRGLFWSSQGPSRGWGQGNGKTFSKLGGRMKQGLREVLIFSVPALPLPSLPFQGADFILIQRETKQGKAGEREKSLSAPLSVPHSSWGGGIGEAESGVAYPKPLKRLSRVTGSNFTRIVQTLLTPAHTDFSPVSSLPYPLLYLVNEEGDRY